MERKYSVQELNALRQAVENKYLYGSYALYGSRTSRNYMVTEKDMFVEENVRTHMLAGHTAQDLYDSESKEMKCS